MMSEVKKCADARDIKGLRYIFVDCLDVDPTFEKYREDYEFCKNIEGLFDAHQDLSGIDEQKENWTTNYWEQLKLDLMRNFSKVRFEHMINVAKVVYADKISRLLNERNSVQSVKTTGISETVDMSNLSTGEYKRKTVEKVDVKPILPTTSKVLSDAEAQEKMIEKRKRELEEENRRIEAEQAAQQKRIEVARRESENRQRTTTGGNGLKKALGIVLAVVIVVLIVVVIKTLL